MAYVVPRAVVDAFYKAYAARDVEKIAEFLDDDVEWTISGPVDVLPFCGTHRGKANVLDMIGRRVPDVLRCFSFVLKSIAVDGDQVAMLNRQSSKRASDAAASSATGSRTSCAFATASWSKIFRCSTASMRSSRCSAIRSSAKMGRPADRGTMIAL